MVAFMLTTRQGSLLIPRCQHGVPHHSAAWASRILFEMMHLKFRNDASPSIFIQHEDCKLRGLGKLLH